VSDDGQPQPCGLRNPACPRPDYCDDCLPRDRKQLHERILVRCDPAWYGLDDNPPKVFAALRAVVLLCVDEQVLAIDGRYTDVDLLRPSELLAAIGAEFGIREVTPGA
jgi:hypothetical protein